MALRLYGPYPALLAALTLPLLVLGAAPVRWFSILGLCGALLAYLSGTSVRPRLSAPALLPLEMGVAPTRLTALPQDAFRAVAALALADHLCLPRAAAGASRLGSAQPQPAPALL